VSNHFNGGSGSLGLGLSGETVPPGLDYFGHIFWVSAAFFGIAGALALKNNLTPFPEPLSHARLVQHGIYAYIRHPLYTCVVCAALGWALVWHSGPAFIIALVMVPFFESKARAEERWLQERFAEYSDYANRTKRFFPWIY
jgi:protein-S-isoprenylcysteine O-methyltransferase Ste14